MTTRFSLSELSEMLHAPLDLIRLAVDTLSGASELTAESFLYGERNWRIAPSDVKKIQDWIGRKLASGEYAPPSGQRRVNRRVVEQTTPDGD